MYDSVPDMISQMRKSCGPNCFCAAQAEQRLASGESEAMILDEHNSAPMLGLGLIGLLHSLAERGVLTLTMRVTDVDAVQHEDGTHGMTAFDVEGFLAEAGKDEPITQHGPEGDIAEVSGAWPSHDIDDLVPGNGGGEAKSIIDTVLA